MQSAFNFHLANFSLPWLLFNSGVMYTVGNYHVTKYGKSHFLRLLGLSALGGSLAAAYAVHNDRNFTASSSIALTGGLLGYNIFKNPQWFRYGLRAFPLLFLFTLYSAFYNDRAALGGLSAGYLFFVLGL